MPNTEKILPFGGEVRIYVSFLFSFSLELHCILKILYLHVNFQDICRCLLWTQRHYQKWPQIRTDVLAKPIDMLMLNQLKESYCDIRVSWIILAILFF